VVALEEEEVKGLLAQSSAKGGQLLFQFNKLGLIKYICKLRTNFPNFKG